MIEIVGVVGQVLAVGVLVFGSIVLLALLLRGACEVFAFALRHLKLTHQMVAFLHWRKGRVKSPEPSIARAEAEHAVRGTIDRARRWIRSRDGARWRVELALKGLGEGHDPRVDFDRVRGLLRDALREIDEPDAEPEP